jgi:deoxyribodipyrimidine photo-lyase
MSGRDRSLSLFWFRRDLRLEDNCGLYHALSGEHPVLPLFIFDDCILKGLENREDARVSFIHRRLGDLQRELIVRGSTLLIRVGRPLEVWKQVCDELPVAAVYANHDYEPYAVERDREVGRLLGARRIPFHTFKDQVVFEKFEIGKAGGGPYLVYTPYRRQWMRRLTDGDLRPFPSSEHLRNLAPRSPAPIPSLRDIGFRESEISIPPVAIEEELIRNYDKTRDYPAIRGTTRLGVHLRFGSISIRRLAAAALRLNETFLGELIWREFFMMLLHHFPNLPEEPFRAEYASVAWRDREEDFDRWCAGQTGFPFVDAGMRELNATGFMHNRVRMVAASFLSKILLIDWRWGERYFASRLLDYELASNVGNWQWAAGCGADAVPYFRIFNPERQKERFDPEGRYIRRWVPEYGGGYTSPMTDYEQARRRALEVYGRAAKGRRGAPSGRYR